MVQKPHPLPHLLAAKQLMFLVNFIPVKLKKVQTKKAKKKKLKREGMLEMVKCWTDLLSRLSGECKNVIQVEILLGEINEC